MSDSYNGTVFVGVPGMWTEYPSGYLEHFHGVKVVTADGRSAALESNGTGAASATALPLWLSLKMCSRAPTAP